MTGKDPSRRRWMSCEYRFLIKTIKKLVAEKDGIIMVWHYNAFLSYEVEPAEEQLVWLDAEKANLIQVDVNAYFLENGVPAGSEVTEQIKLAESLYANAKILWEEDSEVEKNALDRRA